MGWRRELVGNNPSASSEGYVHRARAEEEDECHDLQKNAEEDPAIGER